MTTALTLAVLLVAAVVAVYVLSRRAGREARKDVLAQLARSYGIETMLTVGEGLGWIADRQETPTGVKVKLNRKARR